MTENMAEHSIHCLPCSGTTVVVSVTMAKKRFLIDVQVISPSRHSAKVLSTAGGNSIAAMVKYLRRHLTYHLREAWNAVHVIRNFHNLTV